MVTIKREHGHGTVNCGCSYCHAIKLSAIALAEKIDAEILKMLRENPVRAR